MADTRSARVERRGVGFWVEASIVVLALLAALAYVGALLYVVATDLF